MKPPERKNRGRRGIVKNEPDDDARASLPPPPPPAQSPPAEAVKPSLIVKLPLPAGRPAPRPSKIVKLKVPPIPPRPEKIVKLPMRPSNMVGVANASNDMRIEAQVEAIERRQRERERASTRPHTRSLRGLLPPPLSPPRLHSPALKGIMERTNAPRRVRFNLDSSGLPPQISPPNNMSLMTPQLPEGLGPYPPGFEPDAQIKSPPNMPPPMRMMTPSLPEGLGPYPPGFEPDAEIRSPPNMPPPMRMMTPSLPEGLGPYPPGFEPDAVIKTPPNMPPPMLPMAPSAPASRFLLPPRKPVPADQRGIITLAHERTTAPADIEALLSPPPSTFLAPPSRALPVKPKRGRPRGGGRQRQVVVSHPVPTGIPQGPVPLYPYGHKWELEPKEQFMRRFKRINEEQEAKKEEDKKWNAMVAESCRRFREQYPNADEELMRWRSQRRPANWETYSGV